MFPKNDGTIWRISSVWPLSYRAPNSSSYHSTLQIDQSRREMYKRGPAPDDNNSPLDYNLSPHVK